MRKYFSLSVAFSIVLLFSGISLASINDGLVAYYPFNGNPNDQSGNQLDGTVINGPALTEDRLGNPESAYYFDGVSQSRIELPPDKIKSFLNGASAFTASAWIFNAGPGDNYRNILRLCDTGLDSRGVMFRLGASQIVGNPPNRFEVLVGTQGYQYQHISSTTDIPIGTWTHLAVVYDGSKIWLYINGVAPQNVYRNDVLTLNGVVQTGAVTIGTSPATISGGGNENFNGKIDDIFLFSRALSPSEITQLYTGVSSLDIGLVAYYPFDENADDMSGNNHHGTVYGATLTQVSPSDNAYLFDGSIPNYISIQNDSTLNPEQITIAAWINLSPSTHDSAIIMQNYSNPPQKGYALVVRYPSNLLSFILWRDTNDVSNLDVDFSIVTGVWKFVVATYDGQYMRLYLDGVLLDSVLNTGGYSASDITNMIIGDTSLSPGGNPEHYFSGMINDVRIFKRALSEGEIQDLFDNMPPTPTICLTQEQLDQLIFDAVASKEAIIAEKDLLIEDLTNQNAILLYDLNQGVLGLNEIELLLNTPAKKRTSDSYYDGQLGDQLNTIIQMLLPVNKTK